VAFRNGRAGQLLSLAAGIATIFMLAACGSSKPDVANGRVLFQNGVHGGQACSYCHTMRAAFAGGPFGPNIDRWAARHRAAGSTEADLRARVRDWIDNSRCIDPNDPSRCMPKDLVKGGDASDVAAFIARCGNTARRSGCLPPVPASHLVGRGEILNGALYCQGCHSTNGNEVAGPTYKDLAGSKVTLADGRTVTADDEYLMESIRNPDAQIVKGFHAGFMSKLVKPGSVTPAQARALVAYIKTLK
jgi:mono/diheme cytochrome c family protein